MIDEQNLKSKISNCKSCNAEIVWMKTLSGKNICVDAETCDPETDVLYDKDSMTCHFATCPFGEKHSGNPRTAGNQPTIISGESSLLAKKLNTAMAILTDIVKNAPDGTRSVELARAGLSQIRAIK